MPLRGLGLILVVGFALGFAAVPLARLLDPPETIEEFHPLRTHDLGTSSR